MSQAPRLNFDLDTVREVAQLLRESELSEICIETTGEDDKTPARLLLRRASGIPVAAPLMAAPITLSPETTEAQSAGSEEGDTVKTVNVPSPAVGLFRPAPKNPVKEGDIVKAGQTLGMVESLRVPNEVTTPQAGRIREMRAHDGQGVEFGQVLFVIEEGG